MSSKTPMGVQYNNPNTTEYQLFPEEYFSGSDVTFYFGDIFVSEISALEFTLQEKVNPLYGYASYTWDDVARGSRLVTGSFKIPFSEAGYLDTILNRISKGADKPSIAYEMAGETVPQWAAGAKETIEQALQNKQSKTVEVKEDDQNTLFEDKCPIFPGTKGKHMVKIRELLKRIYGDNVFKEKDNELIQYIKKEYKYLDAGGFTAFAAAMKQKWNSTLHKSKEVEIIQRMLNYYNGENNNPDLKVTGLLDKETTDGIINFLEAFRYRSLAKAVKESSSNPKGVAEIIPYEVIMLIAGWKESQKENERYTLEIMPIVMKFCKENNLDDSGLILKSTVKKLYEKAGDSSNVERKQLSNEPELSAESRFANYEKEVWGRDFSNDTDHRYQTYFYTDRSEINNPQEILKEKGFDIYITYGPTAAAIKENDNKLSKQFNFRSTVKAVRKVQLTSEGQTIYANGEPVETLYTFMAQDLD